MTLHQSFYKLLMPLFNTFLHLLDASFFPFSCFFCLFIIFTTFFIYNHNFDMLWFCFKNATSKYTTTQLQVLCLVWDSWQFTHSKDLSIRTSYQLAKQFFILKYAMFIFCLNIFLATYNPHKAATIPHQLVWLS